MSTPEFEYVQPIMLLVDKENPADHSDAISAAALASVHVYANDTSADPAWDEWLSGPFAKSVRRASAKDFDKVLAGFDPSDYSTFRVGRARAAAFRPVLATAMPKPLARLQVSGTELPALNAHAAGRWVPTIVLNGGLGMSTGKAAAQGAHALFLYYLDNRGDPSYWLSPEARVIVAPGEATEGLSGFEDVLARVRAVQERGGCVPPSVITDAGRTEIAAGSVTAFAYGRSL